MMQADRPLIAIDVSKGKSHVQGFLSFGEPIGRPFVARHDKEGMAKIAALADRLLRESGTKPAVAFESTGAYSGPIGGPPPKPASPPTRCPRLSRRR